MKNTTPPLWLNITPLAKLYAQNHNKDFDIALRDIYASRLYTQLADRETKLWHFSSTVLEELLSEEVKFGTYKIPEVF
ncbi:hypothetical protein FACS189421_09710 [Bacteroidia bacterium]|nr:hypothetical protein FACS189421_09710 [Bacteroidia bacterium]GHT87808.1 hypothetical protein FACS189474_1590 [Bacteroidia bacterium]